jgi:hypothetical protein
VTFHLPFPAGILITDRNRADLDWKNGSFPWRYRNKLTLERSVSIRSYHLIPYIAAEPFYESQYKKWSTTDLYAGSLFPVGKHVEFNPYFEFENDTGKKPNRQQYYVGLSTFTFPWKRSSHQVKQRPATQAFSQTLKKGSGLVDEYQRLPSCLERRSPRQTDSSLARPLMSKRIRRALP